MSLALFSLCLDLCLDRYVSLYNPSFFLPPCPFAHLHSRTFTRNTRVYQSWIVPIEKWYPDFFFSWIMWTRQQEDQLGFPHDWREQSMGLITQWTSVVALVIIVVLTSAGGKYSKMWVGSRGENLSIDLTKVWLNFIIESQPLAHKNF